MKKIISLIQISLLILAATLVIRLIVDPSYNKIGGVLVSLISPFLPNIINKIFKIKISSRLQITYLAFLFFALFLGIDLDFYKTVPHFDKIAHFVSGALSVILAWYTLRFFKLKNTSKTFQSIFIICFCVTIAVAWECYEFTYDQIFDQNMQELISSGVEDTMWDLILATLGASIGTIIITRHQKTIEKLI